jgi:hypothetical protein
MFVIYGETDTDCELSNGREMLRAFGMGQELYFVHRFVNAQNCIFDYGDTNYTTVDDNDDDDDTDDDTDDSNEDDDSSEEPKVDHQKNNGQKTVGNGNKGQAVNATAIPVVNKKDERKLGKDKVALQPGRKSQIKVNDQHKAGGGS